MKLLKLVVKEEVERLKMTLLETINKDLHTLEFNQEYDFL